MQHAFIHTHNRFYQTQYAVCCLLLLWFFVGVGKIEGYAHTSKLNTEHQQSLFIGENTPLYITPQTLVTKQFTKLEATGFDLEEAKHSMYVVEGTPLFVADGTNNLIVKKIKRQQEEWQALKSDVQKKKNSTPVVYTLKPNIHQLPIGPASPFSLNLGHQLSFVVPSSPTAKKKPAKHKSSSMYASTLKLSRTYRPVFYQSTNQLMQKTYSVYTFSLPPPQFLI